MALFVYFVYHCHPYIVLISMKAFLLLVITKEICTIHVGVLSAKHEGVYTGFQCDNKSSYKLSHVWQNYTDLICGCFLLHEAIFWHASSANLSLHTFSMKVLLISVCEASKRYKYACMGIYFYRFAIILSKF